MNRSIIVTACLDRYKPPKIILDYHKILVAGGLNSTGVSFDDVEIIDLESSATICQSFTSLPNVTHSGIGGLGFGEEPFVCGGHDRVCFHYRDESWIPESNLPEVQGHSAFCPSPFTNENYKLFVTGGYSQSEWLNSTLVLTPDGWETLPLSLPVTIYDHCSLLLNSTTVMVIGGHQSSPGSAKNTYLFNADTNEWTEGPFLSTDRCQFHQHFMTFIFLHENFMHFQFMLVFLVERKW